MSVTSAISVLVIAAIHVAIATVEIFLWKNPFVYQRLGFTADVAAQVAPSGGSDCAKCRSI